MIGRVVFTLLVVVAFAWVAYSIGYDDGCADVSGACDDPTIREMVRSFLEAVRSERAEAAHIRLGAYGVSEL